MMSPEIEDTDPMQQHSEHTESPHIARPEVAESPLQEQEACPTVSAVIPAYNAAETIERALDSVYAQTYDNIIEVIVVDDGSTDNTAEIISGKYPAVTLIQQENAGRSIARNRGVSATSGRYIAFLDADDEWLPQKTSHQMECFLKRAGLQMIIADSMWVDAIGNTRQPSQDDGTVRVLRFRDVFPMPKFPYGPPGWMISRHLWESVGGFSPDFPRSQDLEWLWRALIQGFAVAWFQKTCWKAFPSTLRLGREHYRKCQRLSHDALSTAIEGYAKWACKRPALISDREATRAVAEYYWTTAWRMWNLELRTETHECLSRVLELSDARGLRALRERLAAWWPGLYRGLWRLRDASGH